MYKHGNIERSLASENYNILYLICKTQCCFMICNLYLYSNEAEFFLEILLFTL